MSRLLALLRCRICGRWAGRHNPHPDPTLAREIHALNERVLRQLADLRGEQA